MTNDILYAFMHYYCICDSDIIINYYRSVCSIVVLELILVLFDIFKDIICNQNKFHLLLYLNNSVICCDSCFEKWLFDERHVHEVFIPSKSSKKENSSHMCEERILFWERFCSRRNNYRKSWTFMNHHFFNTGTKHEF